MDRKKIQNIILYTLIIIVICLVVVIINSQREKINELNNIERPYYKFNNSIGTKYFSYAGKEFVTYETKELYGCELKDEQETFSVYCELDKNQCTIRIMDWDCMYESNVLDNNGCIDINEDNSGCITEYLIKGKFEKVE